MYQRVVCFKFKAGTSEADIQQHMESFSQLKALIPQIHHYSGGGKIDPASEPSADYDTFHYLTFTSLEDIEAYFHHEAHQAFIAAHRSLWANVLVMNAAME